MSTPKEKSNEDIRRDAILASAREQFANLLDEHFADIVKAAEKGFVGDWTQTEPTAKAAFSVEWSAVSASPKVVVKIGWSVRFKDESEVELDPLQRNLLLPEVKK